MERTKTLESIYNKFENWKTNFPNEIDIWNGDSGNIEILDKNSPSLEIWQKWKINREEEDQLVELAKSQLDSAKNLIDIDAISWGFNQFIHERKIDSLIKIINKWKEDNSKFISEFNLLDIRDWLEYDLYQQKANEEYKKVIARCLRFPNSTKKENFLGNEITPQDIQLFLEMRHKNFINNSEINDYKFNLDDIRKLELWVKSNHLLDWDNWARINMNWNTYVRNGYAHMYQEVWWKKNETKKNYWECEDNAIPKGYNYNPEFKRRLIVRKLKHINSEGGII